MDVRFLLHGITFIWDADKAVANRRKHGIPFEQAAEAFFDPFLKVVDASRHEEARDASSAWISVGICCLSSISSWRTTPSA